MNLCSGHTEYEDGTLLAIKMNCGKYISVRYLSYSNLEAKRFHLRASSGSLTGRAGRVMKGNLLKTSPENNKKQQEDADMFMKEQSEETQEQQTKDKIERWMSQVRVDRPEEVLKWSTDSSRVFLSAAQVEMQRNHVQVQKNNARVNKLHARTQNLRGVPSAIIPEHAVRALQAAKEARKSAEYSQTQRDVEFRRRSWGSTAGEAYVDFIFHASEYELDFYFTN